MGQEIFAIERGVTVRDQITGLEGVVVARAQWLNGCIRYAIQPVQLDGGKMMDEVWLDEGRVDVVGSAGQRADGTGSPGGPQRDPKRAW